MSHYAYRTAKTVPVTVIFTSRFLFMHAEDGEHARLPWNQVSDCVCACARARVCVNTGCAPA